MDRRWEGTSCSNQIYEMAMFNLGALILFYYFEFKAEENAV